jgi:hypothetical protein
MRFLTDDNLLSNSIRELLVDLLLSFQKTLFALVMRFQTGKHAEKVTA